MSIYFAKADDRPEIRIGFCNGDIAHRIRVLQNGNVSVLRCIRVLDGGTRDEVDLHERFKSNWVCGSWYHPDPAMFGDLGFPDLPLPAGPFRRSTWRKQPYTHDPKNFYAGVSK